MVSAPLPDDSVLSTLGGDLRDPATGPERLLLIACGALAREVLAVTAANKWSHFDLICLPAKLHNVPHQISGAVRAKVIEHRAEYTRIFVLYADCGTGGLLQATCDELGVTMLAGPHCYAFFDGVEAFAERAEVTSFFLTDFLARQFDTLVWKGLALDRHPELRDAYFGNYDSLVYLAQTEDAALTDKARAAAAKLGLRFDRRVTGYGDLARELSREAER